MAFPMSTGTFLGNTNTMFSEFIDKHGIHLLNRFVENAVMHACIYAQSAGRDNLSGEDMLIGLKYESQQFCNRNYNLESDSDYDVDSAYEESEDSESEDSQEDDVFTESTSDNEVIKAMNNCVKNWESWVPQSPIECCLKSAIDSASHELLTKLHNI